MKPPSPRVRRVVLATAVVGALLGVFSGFGAWSEAPVAVTRVSPGSPLDAGDAIYSFASATARPTSTRPDAPWQVVVLGTAHNPNETATSPGLRCGFELEHPDASPDDYCKLVLGPSGTPDSPRLLLPPGTAPMPVELKFQLDRFQPGANLTLRIVPRVFTDQWVLGVSHEGAWSPVHDRLIVVTLPLTVLPAT